MRWRCLFGFHHWAPHSHVIGTLKYGGYWITALLQCPHCGKRKVFERTTALAGPQEAMIWLRAQYTAVPNGVPEQIDQEVSSD